MSTSALALIIALAAAALGAGALALWLGRQVRMLRREEAERRAALARTSKLLIDKNMELFDQNLRQQRELESKEDFIGIVSHQLRTPATEVRWGIDALGGEMEKRRHAPRELEYFHKLERSAERMVRLIDSLVRLMSVERDYARQPTETAYEPDAVIRTVAEELARRFADKRISLTLVLEAPGPLTSITQASLELVVENLVENAYDYTPAGGRVTVATEHAAGGGFACTVSDTGVGIPKERAALLFHKFERADDARMNESGMGLGLYLVKNIIERHGGAITVESEVGKGASFRFTLPAKRPARESLKVEPGEGDAAR